MSLDIESYLLGKVSAGSLLWANDKIAVCLSDISSILEKAVFTENVTVLLKTLAEDIEKIKTKPSPSGDIKQIDSVLYINGSVEVTQSGEVLTIA